jgi:hypothetical protein
VRCSVRSLAGCGIPDPILRLELKGHSHLTMAKNDNTVYKAICLYMIGKPNILGKCSHSILSASGSPLGAKCWV